MAKTTRQQVLREKSSGMLVLDLIEACYELDAAWDTLMGDGEPEGAMDAVVDAVGAMRTALYTLRDNA